MNSRNKTIGGIAFAIAIVTAVAAPFMLGGSKATTYYPPNPTEIPRADLQHVNEQIAPFCQPPNTIKAEFTMPKDKNATPVPVFIWHRITDDDKPSHEVTPIKVFREQMKYLKDQGYNSITISELDDYMDGRIEELPPKPVVITFDDGWKDNLEAAKWIDTIGLSASFYVISGFFNNPNYLNEEDVKEIASNPHFEIGSHSHTHFIEYENKIDKLDICTMAREMAVSKKILERVTGKPVRSIAWPYGHNTHEAVYVAGKLGYRSTLMVNRESKNQPGNSPLFTQRLNVDGTCGLEEFKYMLQTGNLKECS